MKKRIVLLCFVIMLSSLFDCGCVMAEHKDMQHDIRTLTLAVEPGLSSQANAGVECFAEKVKQVSNGQLLINVIESDNLFNSLDDGCELIFGSTTEMARANGNFNSYTSPFYFYDYKHLTLTLNSKSFHDIIRDTNISLMNSMPIGAFYDGSSVIVSSRDKMFDTVDQYQDSIINILEDPVLAEVLKSFGATVKERSEEYLYKNFGRNRGNAVMECNTMKLKQLTIPEDIKDFFVCKSFHRARINWLVLSQTAKADLSSFEQAVITEATAYAIAKNDKMVLAQEEENLDYIEERGAQVVAPNHGEFSEAADKVLRDSIHYGSLWDWEQHVEIRKLAITTAR